MKRGAYYNEFDGAKAAWLRELIVRNLIAPGDVDERSIADVQPTDLSGYAQCHFFAGIGVWSYALRLSGWPDDRRVWTGSCPCQSFSAAGKGAAFNDPRHLWPVWFRLVRECRPNIVFGEQVSAAIRHDWLDLVSTDLEAEGYAVGSAVFGAHSVGAPHQRQRLWWVADAGQAKRNTRSNRHTGKFQTKRSVQTKITQRYGNFGGLANNRSEGCQQIGADTERRGVGSETPRLEQRPEYGGDGSNFWSACDWLPCRDGKFRPVESGTFPLAHGAPERVGRLRGYGDAIVASQAATWIEVCSEAMNAGGADLA